MKELHVFLLERCLMDTGLQLFQGLDWAEYNLFLFTVIKKFFWVFCAGLASNFAKILILKTTKSSHKKFTLF
jgi:hypothetical protein